MRRFIKVAGLLIAGQVLLWIILGSLARLFAPRLEPVLKVGVSSKEAKITPPDNLSSSI
jgi:hypothetical protein